MRATHPGSKGVRVWGIVRVPGGGMHWQSGEHLTAVRAWLPGCLVPAILQGVRAHAAGEGGTMKQTLLPRSSAAVLAGYHQRHPLLPGCYNLCALLAIGSTCTCCGTSLRMLTPAAVHHSVPYVNTCSATTYNLCSASVPCTTCSCLTLLHAPLPPPPKPR